MTILHINIYILYFSFSKKISKCHKEKIYEIYLCKHVLHAHIYSKLYFCNKLKSLLNKTLVSVTYRRNQTGNLSFFFSFLFLKLHLFIVEAVRQTKIRTAELPKGQGWSGTAGGTWYRSSLSVSHILQISLKEPTLDFNDFLSLIFFFSWFHFLI